MVVVTDPSKDFKFSLSSRGNITLVKGKANSFHFKKYNKRSFTNPTIHQQNILIAEEKRRQWGLLTQQEQDDWDTSAQPMGMLGINLFIAEGYKQYMRSRYNIAIYGQSIYMKST